jgi:DNA-binding NarL/FixJ family response regulator
MSSQLLSEALGKDEQLEVVGATAGGTETLQAVIDLSPAVVLVSEALDDAQDGGIQLVKDLYRGSLGVRFVVLLESNRRETVVEAFKPRVCSAGTTHWRIWPNAWCA